MAEATARTVCPADLAVVPVRPPPQYVLALAWSPGQHAAAVCRFLSYLRSYRERHAWIAKSGSEPGARELVRDLKDL